MLVCYILSHQTMPYYNSQFTYNCFSINMMGVLNILYIVNIKRHVDIRLQRHSIMSTVTKQQ